MVILSILNLIDSICDTQEIGDVGNGSIKERPASEGAKTKSSSTGVEDISIGTGLATHIESSGVGILAQDSKLVEQDDIAQTQIYENSKRYDHLST